MSDFLDTNERYKIISELGTGSFGIVYKVYDTVDRQNKAIKKLKIDNINDSELTKSEESIKKTEKLWEQFIKESQIGRNFRHIDNLVKIEYIEVDKQQNLIFIIMEYLGEINLNKWLEKNPIHIRDLDRVYLFMKELLEIFLELHKNNVIHRDIKPSNIMFRNNKLIITDLGLSKMIDKDSDDGIYIKESKNYSLEKAYKAPEELLKETRELNVGVDIYSLGIVFYKLLTCTHPFGRGYDDETTQKISTDDNIEYGDETVGINTDTLLEPYKECIKQYEKVTPPSQVNGNVNELFDNFVLKMFKCFKEDRFQNIGEALNELESILIRVKGFELIEEGKFIKGEKEGAREVFVDSFYISTHSITNKEYKEFLEDKKVSATKPSIIPKDIFTLNDDFPVVNVSWDDAILYCKWRSQKENKTYRLPTENEWERVCKNDSNFIYSFGYESDDIKTPSNIVSVNNKFFTNYLDNEKDKNKYKYKCFLMTGHIWEWCLDSYDESHKVIKGGAYNSEKFEKRCSFSTFAKESDRRKNIGFRVVIEK